MSRSMTCDECGSTLILDRNDESSTGEDAAWLHIRVGALAFDVCTRACAHRILDDADVVAAIEEHQAVIADIARMISEGDES